MSGRQSLGAGGPGRPENNLVRFGLAAVFWAVLLLVAEQLPRLKKKPNSTLF